MSKKLSTEEFIKRAKQVHSDRYGYSEVQYVTNKTKVKIFCKEHGFFYQEPTVHLLGCNCPLCAGNNIKSTIEQFIQKSRMTHGDRYDYSLVRYVNRKTKVEIICPLHGSFFQTPDAHTRGCNCPECAGNIKLTKDKFIKKSRTIHGDRYDYSKTVYTGYEAKLNIYCHTHGDFSQTPHDHLGGCGCPQCGKLKNIEDRTLTTEIFRQRARLIHGLKYDYEFAVYKDSQSKVKIICSQHGPFLKSPDSHISQRQGCPKCADRTLTKEEFVNRSVLVHGCTYDYSFVFYQNSYTKVDIRCKKHGSFLQVPFAHLRGQGCPSCKVSSGEFAIGATLAKLGISYESQKRFSGCKDEIRLPFDFFFTIHSHRFLIEYDGRQHFESIELWGGQEYLAEIQHHDAIKTAFAASNGFILIRIPYTQFDNIETILKTEIQKHT